MNALSWWVVCEKELRDVLRRPGLIGTMGLPLVLLTLLAVLALYAAGLEGAAAQMPTVRVRPDLLASASAVELAQYAALSPFFLMWLIFPVTIPSTLAAYSIVGEKEEGTLEPLLATPLTTAELLVGKALAAALPGAALIWVPWLVTLAAGYALTTPRVMAATLLSPLWLSGMALLAPALSFFTVMLLVIVSSRVNDVRTANQIGGTLVIPLVGLFVSQVGSGLSFGPSAVLGAFGFVLAAGLMALAVAVRLFQRESILVRWKQSR